MKISSSLTLYENQFIYTVYIYIYIYKYILFYFHVYVFAVHLEKVSGTGEVSFREVFITHHAQLS